MNWNGILIGAAAFLIIGLFHPIVVKCEYYFSSRVWPVFLIAGLGTCAAAAAIDQITVSAVLSILGFSMLWSVGELRQQEQRVRKGWFPANPKRKNPAAANSVVAGNNEEDSVG